MKGALQKSKKFNKAYEPLPVTPPYMVHGKDSWITAGPYDSIEDAMVAMKKLGMGAQVHSSEGTVLARMVPSFTKIKEYDDDGSNADSDGDSGKGKRTSPRRKRHAA